MNTIGNVPVSGEPEFEDPRGPVESGTIPSRSVSTFQNSLEQLNPAYFALVMSTGIVSIAAHLQGFDMIAKALFGFNIAAYPILWLMYICRMIWFTEHFRNDFLDHFFLGHRDMVDPDAHHTWRMASRLSPFPLALQSAVLGRCLPPRNVHGLHP